jgi:hypothetical protein
VEKRDFIYDVNQVYSSIVVGLAVVSLILYFAPAKPVYSGLTPQMSAVVVGSSLVPNLELKETDHSLPVRWTAPPPLKFGRIFSGPY